MRVLDWMLDRSILFSFDRSGYRRHSTRFAPGDLEVSMRGKVCIVTGANSGLGFEMARGLALRGAAVHMLCRAEGRGRAAQRAIADQQKGTDVQFHLVDVSSPDSIRCFAAGFSSPHVHVLIHNAGLLPLERKLTPEGLELTVATHLVGPFLLTQLLRPKLRNGRVIFVSSGGMYAKRLDVEAMMSNDRDYDGVAAYAMTKRGQVVLSELLAQDLSDIGASVNATHPGWAATKGVERSLPRFWQLMRTRLRTPEEGADTALWLAVAERVERETGRFWFDRSSVPTHLLRRTQEAEKERQRLWQMCEAFSDLSATLPAQPNQRANSLQETKTGARQ